MKIKTFLPLIIAFTSLYSFSQNEFISHWKTNDGTITIPVNNDSVYNYSIEWKVVGAALNIGSASNQSSNYQISGLTTGDSIEIKISGVFPHFFMNNNMSEKNKIYNIIQWGDIQWKTFQSSFYGCENLQISAADQPDLSHVERMDSTFYGATYFNSDISSWDVSNVSNMKYMLGYAEFFNSPLNSWNVGSVTNMAGMFEGAKYFNQDISSWNTSNVTDMSFMFSSAIRFNTPLNSWNTSNVNDISYMFSKASSFNQNLSSWDVQNVINMSNTFNMATAFNQDVRGWNVENVLHFELMFYYAISFNYSLGNWNVQQADFMNNMLRNSGMSYCNMDSTLIGWSINGVKNGINIGIVPNFTSLGKGAFDDLIDNHLWTMTGAEIVPGELSITASAQSICTGTIVNLLAEGANFLVWDDGTTGALRDVQPSQTTTYTVSDGCTKEISLTITVNADPDLTITSNPSSVCTGEPSILTVTGAVSYVWNNGNTSSYHTVTPSATTTYYVSGTDSNGCISYDSVTVIVDECAAVNNEILTEIRVYPNPAGTSFNISSENLAGTFNKYTIIDLTGKELISEEISSDNQLISTEILSEGVYFVILSGSQIKSIKLEIKK